MPTLYIRAATYVANRKVSTNNDIDKASCQPGTPKGILSIMATGDVNGMIESHTAKGLSGALNKIETDNI